MGKRFSPRPHALIAAGLFGTALYAVGARAGFPAVLGATPYTVFGWASASASSSWA